MLDDCYEIMSYDMDQWLELKRVMCHTFRRQRAVTLEASLMARTQCQTEYIAMVKSGNEWSARRRHVTRQAGYRGLLSGRVDPTKFPCV